MEFGRVFIYLFIYLHAWHCLFFGSQYVNKKRGKVSPAASHLLQQACILLRQFSEYLDVVVSVARKTDGRHWSELFAAAGKTTEYVWSFLE